MAVTSFYKELNNLSTADFYGSANPKIKKRKLDCGGDYFAVDRFIGHRRQRNVSVKCLTN